MKQLRKRLKFIIAFSVASLLAGFLYTQSLEEPGGEALAFVTMGLDQSVLSTEVSSYEIQRATEHFSDVILGWTLDPSFTRELNERIEGAYSLNARRQEKQNIIFSVSGPDIDSIEPVVEVMDLVKTRINEYNTATNAGYIIALERHSFIDLERSDLKMVLGFLVFGFVFSIALMMFWDYVTENSS